MEFFTGKSTGNLLILHGGAPAREPEPGQTFSSADALSQISETCLAQLGDHDLCEVVVSALRALEDDPQFNAGLGGAIQSDRQVRVSAALMDGRRQSFSGVINALEVRHPSVIAHWLQSQRSRVISEPGTHALAEQLHLPRENLMTEARLADWQKRQAAGGFDTVGCVIRTANGELAAGTSTGGRSFEFPGRVSDSATVAGNYASAFAAISATGIGEEIVDDALAARLETRCRDGLSLEAAGRRCFDEAAARGRNYGWIALHQDGSWVAAHTTPTMSFVVRSDRGILASSSMTH
jgi:L-asparaginase